MWVTSFPPSQSQSYVPQSPRQVDKGLAGEPSRRDKIDGIRPSQLPAAIITE